MRTPCAKSYFKGRILLNVILVTSFDRSCIQILIEMIKINFWFKVFSINALGGYSRKVMTRITVYDSNIGNTSHFIWSKSKKSKKSRKYVIIINYLISNKTIWYQILDLFLFKPWIKSNDFSLKWKMNWESYE